jgi:hypothetical protein
MSNQSFRVTAAQPADQPSLGYIDFLDYAKTFNPETYQAPRLPVVSMISGTGSLEDPYRLDYHNDPYLKSLAFLDRKSKPSLLYMCIQSSRRRCLSSWRT